MMNSTLDRRCFAGLFVYGGILYGVNDSPCYGCKDRKIGCHSKCKKYKEYDDKNKKRRKQRLDDMYSSGVSRDRLDRHCRGKLKG